MPQSQNIVPPDYRQIGFANGTIPQCALEKVGGYYLHPHAAYQFNLMQAAARRAGIRFTLSSGYRGFEKQRQIKLKYEDAAEPGTSSHGWGIAIDIAELVNTSYINYIKAQITPRPESRVDPRIHEIIRRDNPIYIWLNNNAARYGFVNPDSFKDNAGGDESWHWEYRGFSNPDGTPRVWTPPLPALVYDKCADADSTWDADISEVDTTSFGGGQYVVGFGISPYIASTDSLHPNIQFELTRRRVSSETATAHMPFVKLTSLTRVKGENMQDGGTGMPGYCPTLGAHGQADVTFDDIYSPQSNNSAVGWVTDASTKKRVKLITVAGEQTDQPSIPIPGIVSVNVERSTAGPMGVRGGLVKANLKLAAYSVGQLNVLLRYFLRPGTRVVLELGRKSSSTQEQVLENEFASNDEFFQTFNWNRPLDGENGILTELRPLVTLASARPNTQPKDIPQRKFIRKYTYNNFGNYEIFVAYVVTFKVKYTKNNMYEIDLTLHSVQQFEVPVKITGAKTICRTSFDKCKPSDVYDYFDSSKAGNNFNKVLADAVTTNTPVYGDWNQHIIKLNDKGADAQTEGTRTPGYLVSWRFFIDGILHDEKYGLASIWARKNDTESLQALEYLKKSLPPIMTEPPEITDEYGLYSSEVSYHKNLRSTNPGVMIILNKEAQNSLSYDADIRTFARNKQILNVLNGVLDFGELNSYGKDQYGNEVTPEDISSEKGSRGATINSEINRISRSDAVGVFAPRNANSEIKTATLLKGVLIHSNAIREAFTSTDTVANGFVKLLTMMNNSVESFWNLQLLSNDLENPGVHVVDMGLSKPVNKELLPAFDAVPNVTSGADAVRSILNFRQNSSPSGDPDSPKYLYLFNRKLLKQQADDIGSELLDINLESSLPQVVAIQAIAGVGGVAERGVLESIDITELRTLSLFGELYPKCGDDICRESGDDLPCGVDEGKFVTSQLTLPEIKQVREAFNNPTSTEGDIVGLRARVSPATGRNPITGGLTQTSSDYAAVDKLLRELIQNYQQQNSGLEALITQYGNTLGAAIKYIEYDKPSMLKKLDEDRDDPSRGGVHPFNSSNLTKTTVDLTMPGIGGIQLFQAFAVDRVPNILNSGYYVVTKVAHEFTVSNGWITKVQGRFRYKPRRVGTNAPTVPCVDGNPIDFENLISAERDAYRRGGAARLQELRDRGY